MNMENKLLEIYNLGWSEENSIYSNKMKARVFENEIEQRAYDIGRNDFFLGDELSSIDAQTTDEILKRIYGG